MAAVCTDTELVLSARQAEFTTGHFGLAQFIFRAPSKGINHALAPLEARRRVPSRQGSTRSRAKGILLCRIDFRGEKIDEFLPRLPSLFLEVRPP